MPWYLDREILPSRNVQLASFSGLYLTKTPPAFQCRSNKCVWPDVSTLGICKTCTDVTKASSFECKETINSRTKSLTCTYGSPNNFFLDIYSSFSRNLSEPYQFGETLLGTNLNKTKSVIYPSQSEFFLLWSAFVQSKEKSPPIIWRNDSAAVKGQLKHTVYECRLDFCAHSWNNISSVGNTLMVGEKKMSHLNSTGESTDTINAEGQKENLYHLVPTAPDWKGLSVFKIRSVTRGLLNEFLQSLFDRSDDPYPFSMQAVLQINNDIEATLDSIAESVTEAMRDGLNSTQVLGETYRDETFVEVRWEWFVVPATVLVLSVVFFCYTILLNRSKHGIIWKSSVLAPLCHEAMSLTSDGYIPEKRSELDGIAEKNHVRLRRDDHGQWRFIKE
jgi:hypothetical protein